MTFAGTEKQERYLRRLLHERGPDGRPTATVLADAGTTVDAFLDSIGSTREASTIIDVLLASPEAPGVPSAVGSVPPAGARAEPGEGVYLVDGDVYRVLTSRESGHRYAKRLVPTDHGKARWEYAPGIAHRLDPGQLMTPEQAAEFGARFGVCGRCGRTLTADKSIERAIGPVCWKAIRGQVAA